MSPAPPPAGDPPAHRTRDVLLGVLAVIVGVPVGLTAIAAVTMAFDVETGAFLTLFAALAIGLVQLLWVIPLAIWAWRSGRTSLLQGVLGGAAVVFTLNAGCYGLLLGTSMLGRFAG